MNNSEFILNAIQKLLAIQGASNKRVMIYFYGKHSTLEFDVYSSNKACSNKLGTGRIWFESEYMSEEKKDEFMTEIERISSLEDKEDEVINVSISKERAKELGLIA